MILEVNRRKAAILVGEAAVVGVAAARGLMGPEAAEGALRSAAGGGGEEGDGGFALLGRFLNRLTDYLIPVGGAFCALGLLYGGFLLMTGDARAGRVLGFVALGVAVVLLSKPIAA